MCRVTDLRTASIKAEAPGSSRHDLEQAACDREVLEKWIAWFWSEKLL
jgi:hypothetical protein